MAVKRFLLLFFLLNTQRHRKNFVEYSKVARCRALYIKFYVKLARFALLCICLSDKFKAPTEKSGLERIKRS